MEEINTPDPESNEEINNLCVNCNQNPFEPGHPVNLCVDCRQKLINFPIPKWIIFFAIGLLAVIAISLIRTQLYISAAIHLGKAEKAIEQKRFSSAKKELALVLEKFPDDIATNADMVIAGSYDQDMASVYASYNKIIGKDLKDDDLLKDVNEAMNYLEANYPTDTLTMKNITAAKGNKQRLQAIYQQADTAAAVIKVYLANSFFDLEDYATAEKITRDVLKTNPNTYGALSLMAAIKRNTGQYDEGLRYCDSMLAINKEDIYSIGQKARIELKRKHDKEAALYANEAMKIDPDSDFALEAKIMVDYFAGRKAESLSRLGLLKAHATAKGDSTVFNRVSAIVNGTEIYR